MIDLLSITLMLTINDLSPNPCGTSSTLFYLQGLSPTSAFKVQLIGKFLPTCHVTETIDSLYPGGVALAHQPIKFFSETCMNDMHRSLIIKLFLYRLIGLSTLLFESADWVWCEQLIYNRLHGVKTGPRASFEIEETGYSKTRYRWKRDSWACRLTEAIWACPVE